MDRNSSFVLQACITIQKHVRGHVVRQLVAKQDTAATVVQCCWKRHRAVADYQSLRCASLRLQAWARGQAARQRYKQTREAVVTLQVCMLDAALH